MADVDLKDGAKLTSDQLTTVADAIREAAGDEIGFEQEVTAALLEALAKAKEDLEAANEAAAQLRKEFEAFKGEVRTRYLPRR